jgi:outer membrane lipoprotein SlyB
MELSRERPGEVGGLLYPLMVIAAIAVIAFSVVGIASITGWMPSGLMSRASAGAVPSIQEVDTARSGVAFECAECGVIETIREIEQRGEFGLPSADTVAMVAS